MLENPFESSGSWYRANLHAHTTLSDGDLSPEEAAEFYRRAGYQVLAITDHGRVTEVQADRPGLLTISG
ncbi:MAG: phosphotransferase, partial [Gemmatimonadales bacterium]|nr:phosphotransferase [Gemmatimonadales bacterium]